MRQEDADHRRRSERLLDAMADAGDFYLEESGFYDMPSSGELQKWAG